MQPATNGHSYTIDTIARDVSTLIEQVGRAPSPATGDSGSGLLRAVAELIAREDERDARAALRAEIASKRLASGQWWSVVASVVAALAAVAALVHS